MFLNLHIETERLIIRPYALTDLDELYAVVSEPDFYRFIPEDVPSRGDVQRIIEWSIQCNNKNTLSKIHKLNLAIVDRERQTLIGYCGLGPGDVKETEVEIYYGISKAYRGQGIAYEAAQALLNYAFNKIGLLKVIAVVHPENVASLRIVAKLGMNYEYTYINLNPELKDFEGLLHYAIDNPSDVDKL
ncbi:GNAT family N-acetyltransferase [Lysinibacillus sp. NPDC056959]|uniref:GNAT family N-acetyltransferase n=1 Tax=Lysinibacillus sp. NPDC056959 TaxID=3345981 RepID=UPI00363A0242